MRVGTDDFFEQRFRRFIGISVFAHLAAVLVLTIKDAIFPGTPLRIPPSSIRVDLVGLPDLLKKDMSHVKPGPLLDPITPKPAPPSEKHEATAPPSKKSESASKPLAPGEKSIRPSKDGDRKVEDRNRSALRRIVSLQKILNETAQTPTAPIKGNVLSKGSSVTGESLADAESSYYDTLRERLQGRWALPVWLARNTSLAAQVVIQIDSIGRVRSIEFLKRSGNTTFDEAVKRTISDSSPLPAPPPELQRALLANGVRVHFPL